MLILMELLIWKYYFAFSSSTLVRAKGYGSTIRVLHPKFFGNFGARLNTWGLYWRFYKIQRVSFPEPPPGSNITPYMKNIFLDKGRILVYNF